MSTCIKPGSPIGWSLIDNRRTQLNGLWDSRLHLNSFVDALSEKGFFKGTVSEDDFLTAMARSDYKIRHQLDLDKGLHGNVNELFFRFFRLAYKQLL